MKGSPVTSESRYQSTVPGSQPAGPTNDTPSSARTNPGGNRTVPERTEQSAAPASNPAGPTSGTPPEDETPSDGDSTVTSTCNSANVDGTCRYYGGSYGGASFHPQTTSPSGAYTSDEPTFGQPWVPTDLGGMFPIPEIGVDGARIRQGENLEEYARRMKKNGHKDIHGTDNGDLIFRSTFMTNGVRGVAWEGENGYRARNGNLYDTTKPPPGRCWNCNGNHWRKDCPRGGRR